jgi:pimeloyl-ACP methyl ester carboxylesterase
MAATYLEKNYNKFDGLILLGSYSTSNLKNTDLKVLSIYGSEDKVMNKEKYLKYKSNLPNDFTEVVIEGGCHAYFGMYGNQDGDGVSKIDVFEQISLTSLYINDFINN